MKPVCDFSLYLVLVPALCLHHSPVEVTRQAVANGITMLQLRMKNEPDAAVIKMATDIKAVLEDVPLIINDNIDIALAVDATGVHLGQDDCNPDDARICLGKEKVIGVSVNTLDHVNSLPDHIDYIGIGPVYTTKTKSNLKPVLGLAGLEKLVAASPVPSVAIGGVKTENVQHIVQTGVNGIAVVSDICCAQDPACITRTFIEKGYNT